MNKDTLMRIAMWAGPILVGLIGVLGGAIGTYFSIKDTKGPRERAFMVRASIVCWVAVSIFVLGMEFVLAPYIYGLIAIYVVALVLAVCHWNKRQTAIRADESKRAA